MRFQIKHEIKGRLRVHVIQKRMSFSQADTLQYYLMGLTGVQKVKIQNRTCDVVIEYDADREALLKELQRFSYQQTEVPVDYLKNSGREMNQYYWDKLVNRVILHYGTKLFLPISVRETSLRS